MDSYRARPEEVPEFYYHFVIHYDLDSDRPVQYRWALRAARQNTHDQGLGPNLNGATYRVRSSPVSYDTWLECRDAVDRLRGTEYPAAEVRDLTEAL